MKLNCYFNFTESLDPSILEELRKEEINKEKLTSTITNIITYSIYIFLLIALATTMNGQNTYFQKEQVERLTNVSSDDTQIRKVQKIIPIGVLLK